jgi:hypothetical protein
MYPGAENRTLSMPPFLTPVVTKFLGWVSTFPSSSFLATIKLDAGDLTFQRLEVIGLSDGEGHRLRKQTASRPNMGVTQMALTSVKSGKTLP